MKKYLAVFLIALMTVSVISAAGVVTAQKASAAPQTTNTITVPYQIGDTYTWTKARFNYHGTLTDMTGAVKPLPRMQATSRGGTASVSVVAKPGSLESGAATANALVGVVVTVTPPSGGWTGTEQATVTINGKYTLSATGSAARTTVLLAPWVPAYDFQVIGGADGATSSTSQMFPNAPVTTSFSSANDLWGGHYDAVTGTYVLNLYVGASSHIGGGPGAASGTVDVSSITLTFNQPV